MPSFKILCPRGGGETAGFINITGMAVAMLVAVEMQISQFTQVSSNVIMYIQYPETRGFDLINEDKRFTLGWGSPRFWWGSAAAL